MKDVPKNEIVNTFKQFQTVLCDIFDKNSKVSDKKIDPVPNDFDYLIVFDVLVTSEQLGVMWKTARTELCKDDVDVSKFKLEKTFSVKLRIYFILYGSFSMKNSFGIDCYQSGH